jgi:hypothetical protein
LEGRIAGTNSYSLQDTNILHYLHRETLPVCPTGGTYHPGKSVEHEPSCSIHGSISAPNLSSEAPADRAPKLGVAIVSVALAFVIIAGLLTIRFWKTRQARP